MAPMSISKYMGMLYQVIKTGTRNCVPVLQNFQSDGNHRTKSAARRDPKIGQSDSSRTAVTIFAPSALELVLDTEPPAPLTELEPEAEMLELPFVVVGDLLVAVDPELEVVGDEVNIDILPPGSTVAVVEVVV